MEFKVDVTDRLDKFLSSKLPDMSRTKLTAWMESEGVWVDGKERKSSFKVEPGMVVTIDDIEPTPIHDLTPSDMPLDIHASVVCMTWQSQRSTSQPRAKV